jgi:hypothetical protein
MLRRISLIATALVALSLSASAAIAQADPYEPNDSQITAYGPLVNGQDYVGTLDTINDMDWFYFAVPYHEQVTITVVPDGSDNCTDLQLDPRPDARLETVFCQDVVTNALTLDRGVYYLGIGNYFEGSASPGFQYDLKVVTSGRLTNRNEIDALNNRDVAIRQVNHYAGQVRSLTGLVHNSQADVKRKTTILRHAHGRNAINRARHNLAVAKRTLASRQRSLKSAQGSLRLWQTRLNIANQQVIQYG